MNRMSVCLCSLLLVCVSKTLNLKNRLKVKEKKSFKKLVEININTNKSLISTTFYEPVNKANFVVTMSECAILTFCGWSSPYLSPLQIRLAAPKIFQT